MEEDNDIEILDVEDYKGKEEMKFSHQALVMMVIKKCINAGCREMISGYYNQKSDKFGNKVLVYIPDARKELIEYIKTARSVMICDFDKEARENIKAIEKKKTDEYKRLINLEKKNWDTTPSQIKKSRMEGGIFYQEGTLNMKLPYYQEYLEFEVNCYREILDELIKLTSRLDFYETPDYEA